MVLKIGIGMPWKTAHYFIKISASHFDHKYHSNRRGDNKSSARDKKLQTIKSTVDKMYLD
jgi:hypothetical protein